MDRDLKELQKQANYFMREARNSLKTDKEDGYLERAYMKTNNRLKMFQKKHNQHKGYLFSSKGLETEEDLDSYKELLKSVTENVRLNPELAQQHRESQIDFYQDQGWAKSRETAEAIYDFKGSSIYEELMDMNLSDIPSELMERYGKFIDASYSIDDFSNMITAFNKQVSLGNKKYKDVKDFYKFTDRYIKLMKKREDDFNKGLSEFLDYQGDEYNDFFTFMEEF